MNLNQNVLASSFFAYWREQFCDEVPVVYPGMQIDTELNRRWIELWVQGVTRTKQRIQSPKFSDISILVHCFSLDENSAKGLGDIANQAEKLLSQQTFAVRDFQQVGAPVVGYTKLFEAESRVFSRERAVKDRSGLQHMIVTCNGLAQAIV